MSNSWFQFKQFIVHQDKTAMKVTTDACILGAMLPSFGTQETPARALDIGAGTGLLSLMFAQKNPDTLIDSVEIEQNAALQAQLNFNHSPWNGQISLFQKDINAFFPDKTYDIIFSNPPFYQNQLQSPSKSKSIAHHSTELSLQALLQNVNRLLCLTGKCWLLLPFSRKEECIALLKKGNFFIETLVNVQNSPKHLPNRIIISFGRDSKSPAESSFCIKEDNQKEYSSDFRQLLSPFYLGL